MKQLLLITSFLLCFAALHGQDNIGKEVKLSPTADSLINVLSGLQGRDQLPVLIQLADETRMDHPSIGAQYIERAEEWIDEEVINREYVSYLVTLCGVRLSQHKFEEGRAIGEKVLSLEYPNKQVSDYFDIYMYLGTAYDYFAEYAKAQAMFFEGLQAVESLGYELEKAGYLNSIGMVFQSMKDTLQTEKHFLQALAAAEKNKQFDLVTIINSNLAIHYTDIKKYDEAVQLLMENIEQNRKNDELSYLGNNYNNLGVIYHYQGKYEQSLSALQNALDIAIELDFPSTTAIRYMNVGEAHMMQGDFKRAETNILKGVQSAKELKSKDYLLNGLITASKLFEGMDKHEIALEYYKEYTALNDSILNENRIEVVAELQEKYETEKKEKEILSLSNENVLAERKLRNLNFTVLGLCFGLLGLGMFLYFLRQNHRKNSIIKDKNLEIASDKIQLLERENEINTLESLVKGQENERERLAKELHDGLGGLLAISHSTLSNLANAEGETNGVVAQARKLVGDAYQQVRQISHNLMPLDLLKFGLVPTLESMIELVNKQNDITFDFNTYHFESELKDEMGLNIYRIVQEAISNILKYANAENVLIELIQHEAMISLTIEDDGEGFDVEKHAEGIGLKNMRNRIERLKGNFEIESGRGSGTSISIQIPHKQSA